MSYCEDYEYENDGYGTEAARNQAALELWSVVDCVGADCSGWILSNCDAWSRCRGTDCGGAGSRHPECDDAP